jgi:L-asparaginase
MVLARSLPPRQRAFLSCSFFLRAFYPAGYAIKTLDGLAMFIKIFSAGGTIDKIYFDAKSDYQVGSPNIEKILADLQPGFDYKVTSLMRKDSLEMTDDDRVRLYQAVLQEPCTHILITHGTDTMVDTARQLASIKDKTLVLTGAMEPAMYKTSDAIFNIGCALAAAQIAPPGCYIAMNGRIFEYDKVRKNVAAGRFEDIP